MVIARNGKLARRTSLSVYGTPALLRWHAFVQLRLVQVAIAYLLIVIFACSLDHAHGQTTPTSSLSDADEKLTLAPGRERLISIGVLRDNGEIITQIEAEELRDEDLEAFTPADLVNLQEVSLRYSVGDRGFASLSKAPSLSELSFEGYSISERSLIYIGQMEQLRTLALIIQDRKISDKSLSAEGLSHLASLSNLRNLRLDGHHITDDGVKSLTPLVELRSLSISSPELSDAALEPIAQLRNLEDLIFSGRHFTGSGVVYLASHPRLQRITLWGESFDGKGLQALASLPELCDLTLGGGNFEGRGLRTLKDAKKLQRLTLEGMSLSEEGATELESLVQLRRLALTTSYKDRHAKSLMRSLGKLTTLESLSIGNGAFTDTDLQFLRTCTQLSKLSLEGPDIAITDEGLSIIGLMTGLTSLGLSSRNDGISDAGLSHLLNLNELTSLYLVSDQITERGVETLSSLKQLQELTIESKCVSAAGRILIDRINRRHGEDSLNKENQ